MNISKQTIALLFLALLTGGCASQKQVESLQKSQEDLRAQMQQHAELLQLQSAYLRYLEDEHYALRTHLEQVGSQSPGKTEPAADGADKAAATPVAPPAPVRPVTDLDGKLILGSQEWVWFDLFKSDVQVAVDDERKFSVLSVTESQLFERDGREWVRFAVDLPSAGESEEEKLQFEAPLERSVKLRTDSDGQPESRPVVKLTIKIGPLVEDVQFALVPATGAEQVATLGRAFLRDIALVDSSRKFIQPQHSSR